MQTKLRILIADDHAVVREGARLLISRQPEWEVCGFAATGREAIDEALRLKPDIVVLDLHMPEMNGTEAVLEIKKRLPDTELVIFSAERNGRAIEQLFEAGAKSFIRKEDAAELLIGAIASAAQHKPFFTPVTSEVLFAKFMSGSRNGLHDRSNERLSTRERQIVRCVADGKSNKETADALGISIRTAETHRAAVIRKLKLSSTAELVRYAIRIGIVEA